MAQVTIEVNGRPYTVGCEDGQEAHLAHDSILDEAACELVPVDGIKEIR